MKRLMQMMVQVRQVNIPTRGGEWWQGVVGKEMRNEHNGVIQV